MSKLKQHMQQHWLLWVCSFITLGIFTWLFINSNSLKGGADTYNHYLISYYLFKHPELLVDQWGKPFFSLVSHPFSWLGGLNGLVIYNILIAVGTGVLAYFTALKLKLKYPIIAFLLVIYAPGYFNNIVSGLTEPTGAFVLLLAVYLYINNKLVWASILISFLPFVRSEGFIILFVVFVYYIVKKHYRYLGLLTAGSLIYSFAAFMLVGHILWLFGSNPYLAQPDGVYGHGDFWHYTSLHEAISGNPLTILWLIGVLVISIGMFKAVIKQQDQNNLYLKFLVFIGAFVAFAFVHSYIWWKGSLGSAGFPRVFAAVMPLMVLIAMEGITWLDSKITNLRAKQITFTLIGLLVFANCFIVSKVPYKETALDEHHRTVFAWLDEQGYDTDTTKVFHMIPTLNVELGLDPYHDKKTEYLIHYVPGKGDAGDLFVWDGLFCAVDIKMPVETFSNNPEFELIKSFDHEQKDLTVKVFRKK